MLRTPVEILVGEQDYCEVYEQTRGRLVEVALDALGLPDDATGGS